MTSSPPYPVSSCSASVCQLYFYCPPSVCSLHSAAIRIIGPTHIISFTVISTFPGPTVPSSLSQLVVLRPKVGTLPASQITGVSNPGKLVQQSESKKSNVNRGHGAYMLRPLHHTNSTSIKTEITLLLLAHYSHCSKHLHPGLPSRCM
jgi:hypothetical protein